MPDPEPTTEEPVVTLAQLEQATDAVLGIKRDTAPALTDQDAPRPPD